MKSQRPCEMIRIQGADRAAIPTEVTIFVDLAEAVWPFSDNRPCNFPINNFATLMALQFHKV